MIFVNDFLKNATSDSEAFARAIASRHSDGTILVTPREAEDGRTFWLIDEAILLPSNTTVILRNTKIKLSDACRDNFFRSANCGLGIEDIAPLFNIHIRGEGYVLLEGADHPRATGDGTKIIKYPCPFEVEDICKYADWIPDERRTPDKITFADRHDYSYGTDANNPDESQYGDWRGIGILFACVDHFSISGLTICESHGWGISLENCAYGRIEHIEFDARMSKMIDGMLHNMENQDGVDIRNGCHDILISDITGETGDDVIALTAIANRELPYRPSGSLASTHVMHNDWTRRNSDIYNITIRDVRAYSSLCFIVRLLPCESRIYNIIIDGITDTSPSPTTMWGGILLGEGDSGYGKNLPGSLTNISISNVIYNNYSRAICISGFLQDSVITNVVCPNTKEPAIYCSRRGVAAFQNVKVSGIVLPDGIPVLSEF